MRLVATVAERHLERVARRPQEPRQDLGVWDKTKVRYQKVGSGDQLGVKIFYGRKKIGICGASKVYPSTWNKKQLKCQSDVDRLAEQYSAVWREKGVWLGREAGYKPAPLIFQVYQSAVADEHHGKRIGLAMYKALIAEIFKEHGAYILISDGCSAAGATSDAAGRVWKSLSKSHPSSGICLAVTRM